MPVETFNIQIPVAYRRPGNVITNQLVPFLVRQDEQSFSVIPLMDQEERKLANLPDELQFQLVKGLVVSEDKQEGIRDLLADIVSAFRGQKPRG